MDVTRRAGYPAITVVMAAYNAESYIARAIGSVRDQSLDSWELICIDDGSTDNTQAIISKFVEKDARIKLITQENAGPASARRQGYVAGIGDYLIVLDSDDWFAADALEILLDEASRTDADAVTCHAMIHKPNSEGWLSFHEQHGTPLGKKFSGHDAFAMTFPWHIHGICLWRKAIVKAAATCPKDAFNRYNADEYITRKLFLACSDVIIGTGKYFIFPNQRSLTRSPSWRKFLSLETDRRLTDLAFAECVSPDVLEQVISWQRQNLTGHVRRFARHGGNGKNVLALREIWRSAIHLNVTASRTRHGRSEPSLLFDIFGAAIRGLAGRFSFARRVYAKLRSQS